MKTCGSCGAENCEGYIKHLHAAEKERDEARRRVEHQTDWYQQRFNRLRRWVKEEVEPLSKEVAHRYFSICANGSPAPHEQADWRDTMHGLTIRAEQAEADAARLREALRDVAERQREACAAACGARDNDFAHTYADVVRETPLVTETKP